jgi:hypothetical protein
MPLPVKKPTEKRDDFIGRCISDSTMKNEFPDSKQRAAVCYQRLKLYKGNIIPFNNIYSGLKKDN